MLILFDLDDTLLDHTASAREAAIRLHEITGAPQTLPDFLSAWDKAQERNYARYESGELTYQEQRRERLREVVDPKLTDKAADALFNHYLEAYEENWKLFDDALPCLTRLVPFRLGLITNGDGQLQRRKLAKTKIADIFDCILISGECGCAKPDKKIFHLACEKLSEPPETTTHIGDRYDLDAQASRTAGLNGIWLNRKTASSPHHTPPIIKSLSEFLPPTL